jgi:hypothetical protein
MTSNQDFTLNTYLNSVKYRILECVYSFEDQHVRFTRDNKFPYGEVELKELTTDEKCNYKTKIKNLTFEHSVKKDNALSDQELSIVKHLFMIGKDTHGDVLIDVNLYKTDSLDVSEEKYCLSYMYGGFYKN